MTRLSDTVRESVCDLVRKLMIPPPTAAQSIGVTFKTFQSWMRKGAADDWALRNTEYSVFYREVARAASDAQIRAQARLLKTTDRVESETLKWLLERWDSETFGRQVTIHIRNSIRQEMATELLGEVHEVLDLESYTRLESRLLADGSEGEAEAEDEAVPTAG